MHEIKFDRKNLLSPLYLSICFFMFNTTTSSRKLHYIFLGLWLILNLLQAGFTELAHDEAYYWMYSRFPDWGHFHQPPLIGILTGIGYSIFPNELGVRLMCVLLTAATLFILKSAKRNVHKFQNEMYINLPVSDVMSKNS